eukprot:PITA_01518
MNNHEGIGSIRPPIFNGRNLVYWKIRTRAYLQSLGPDVWEILKGGYQFPAAIPTGFAGKNLYETDAKAVNTLLGSLSKSKMCQSYAAQGSQRDMGQNHSKLRRRLLDEVVNCMKNLGEEIKEATLVEKMLRSLSYKFESKVSATEEKQDLQIIIVTQLHGILTAFEMRKGGPSDMREAAFKASVMGKEKEENNELGYISKEEDEVNFVKKLQRGSERFIGKLPFKFFACGRVGHYVAKCHHKDKYEKGKEYAKGNRK